MRPAIILRIFGQLLMIYSGTLLVPVLVAALYGEADMLRFLYSFLATLLSGLLCWLPVQNRRRELRVRDGFIIVTLFWSVLSLFGALPYLLGQDLRLAFTDALFESVSGFTTTGATVFTGLDQLPKSLLYYRHQQQWLGGLGIIVLAVAILPMLGVGGMQMYRAETPGAVKDSKLTPRVTETARSLWYIYVALTVACALGYWLCGMDLFDAICHSFSTVSIGGFSTHDASLGFYNSAAIEAVAIVFMLLAGMNFGLHFIAWRRRSLRQYATDGEVRFYFFVVAGVSALVFIGLLTTTGMADPALSLRHALFESVSVITTTGFGVAQYASWHPMLATALIMASFIGACAGSTGSGLKMVRVNLMFKQGLREVRRLMHPKAMILVKLSNRAVPDRVVEAVWGFFGIYLLTFCVLFLLLLLTGMDFLSGFSAVAACLNNLGPGLGDVTLHYAAVSDPAKWILCAAMLLGRLEIFTLLVLFTPMFWRH
ncbi:MAG TPA: TrkH family potassium uptake protein [Candidatus Kapabacteria bacterium]|nr:TrkH family potassium uptake protein [Candidatus Kapabacteria bacterium]